MRARFARILVAALLLLIAAPSHLKSAQRFVEGLEDLPLMEGLESVPEAGVSFDAPEGRIVVAYAQGRVSAERVLGFYAETLPQLGWRRLSEQSFQREAERLSLAFSREPNRLTIRFTLAPRPH